MHIMRVRMPDGRIVEIPGFRGPKGDPGETPKKGVDYFTPEDVAGIVAQVAASAADMAIAEMAPVLLPKNTWYKGNTARNTLTEIRIVDWYEPSGEEIEQWYADVNESGKIKCFVVGTILIISGNGSGRIMANADSTNLFYSGNQDNTFSKVESIEGLSLLDTRNVTSLRSAFNRMVSLSSFRGVEKWNVCRCLTFRQAFANCPVASGTLDLSEWDFSAAVNAYYRGESNEALAYFATNCRSLSVTRLNKSYDMSLPFATLHAPVNDDNIRGCMVDADTGIVYEPSGTTFDLSTGFPNPYAEGRNITYVAVWPEAQYEV